MTTFDLAQLQTWLGGMLWAMARVSGMMLAAPVFSSTVVPDRVRITLTLLLTMVLAPLAPTSIDLMSAVGLATLVAQLLLGAVIGFVLKLVFEAVSFGGQMVSQSMNLSFSEVVDPAGGNSVAVLGQLYMLLITLIFLAMNGHLQLIALLAQSFHTLPPGTDAINANGLHALVMFGGQLFGGAVRVALPAVTSLLVVNIGFAAISRAAPAMNLFAVGFPITITLGIIVLWLSLRSLPGAFESLEDSAWSLMRNLIAK